MAANSATCVTMKTGDWIVLKTGAIVRVCDDSPMQGDTILVDLEKGYPRAVMRSSIVGVHVHVKPKLVTITKR